MTRHVVPWVIGGRSTDIDSDVWELYDTNRDWSQAHDLAASEPERLEELKKLFDIEAAKSNVLPLDARFGERWNPDMSGRPNPVVGQRQMLFGGMHRLQENVVINIKNKSHAVTAQIDVPGAGAEGVIIARAEKPAAGRSTPIRAG